MEEYGLCLSGGGGKGAYELGVWRALIHLGIAPAIKAISGASIGAINGLFMADGEYEKTKKVWDSITNKDFWTVGSRGKLEALIDEEVDFDKVKFSKYRLFINTTIVEKEIVFPTEAEQVKPFVKNFMENFSPEYYEVNDLPKEKIKDIVLASSALPAIYPPVIIDGKKMVDGGLVDNVPIRPLIEDAECKNLIVVMCGQDNEYDLYLASRAEKIIEIRPSEYIGTFVDGTLDFSHKSILFRSLLGFYDTMRVFDMIERKNMGLPYTEEEKLQSIRRDKMNIEAAMSSQIAVNKMEESKKQYDDLLKKYSSRYGIDL